MTGPYITIKVKNNHFEIDSVDHFDGPDAFDLAVKYLKEKYGATDKSGGAIT